MFVKKKHRVTETDKANEKLVYELLKKHFPEHQFIGEVRFWF